MTWHLSIYYKNILIIILYFRMNSLQMDYQVNSKREKMQKKRQKAKEKFQRKDENCKALTKQDIRKEKNRQAAQKSRDRKQEHLSFIQKENQQLKYIISLCERCSQAHHQISYSQSSQEEEVQEEHLLLQENDSKDEAILINLSPPTFSPPSLYLRHEEDSNQSHVSKYFWFCFFVGVICIAHFAGGNGGTGIQESFHFSPRINYEVDPTINSPQSQDKDAQTLLNSKIKKSLMNYSSKQCAKCMECFKNMTTNSTSLTTLHSNKTNSTQPLASNSTKKILFCKSKAFFFKKIYKALEKVDKSSSKSEVGRLRASGKMLAEFMDRDCFSDSSIDENQVYNLEFTVAIMQLTAVNESKGLNLTRNVQVNQ